MNCGKSFEWERKVKIRTLETEGLRHPNTQRAPILVATRPWKLAEWREYCQDQTVMQRRGHDISCPYWRMPTVVSGEKFVR